MEMIRAGRRRVSFPEDTPERDIRQYEGMSNGEIIIEILREGRLRATRRK